MGTWDCESSVGIGICSLRFEKDANIMLKKLTPIVVGVLAMIVSNVLDAAWFWYLPKTSEEKTDAAVWQR